MIAKWKIATAKAEAKIEARNPYKILGLEKTSTENDIKKAYKKLALIYHPNKGGNEEMMKKIGEAYETLINKNKRNQYDTLGTKKFYKM